MYIPLLQKPFRFCASYRLIIPAYPASVNRFFAKKAARTAALQALRAGVRPDITQAAADPSPDPHGKIPPAAGTVADLAALFGAGQPHDRMAVRAGAVDMGPAVTEAAAQQARLFAAAPAKPQPERVFLLPCRNIARKAAPKQQDKDHPFGDQKCCPARQHMKNQQKPRTAPASPDRAGRGRSVPA